MLQMDQVIKKVFFAQPRSRNVALLSLLLSLLITGWSIKILSTTEISKMNIFDPSNLPSDNQARRDHELYKKVYDDPPSSISIVILSRAPEGIFNNETLTNIRDITDKLSDRKSYPWITGVVSLSTIESLWIGKMGAETILGHESYLENVPSNEYQLRELEEKVKNDPLVWGKLITQNAKAIGQIALIIVDVSTDGSKR